MFNQLYKVLCFNEALRNYFEHLSIHDRLFDLQEAEHDIFAVIKTSRKRDSFVAFDSSLFRSWENLIHC